jgi:polysaccharide biosynthesis PFTS motif protein
MLWGVGASVVAGLSLLRGSWANALMLAEAARARAVRLCPGDRLGTEYFFPFSGSIYRPMWTHELERRGVGVTVYFYSTYEQPKVPSGYESQKFEWGPANWPAYMVWDTYQDRNLRRDLGDTLNTRLVGPVHFSDSGAPMPIVPRKSIAVFDIEPHRKSLVFGMTTLVDYLHAFPDAFVRFLEDLAAAIEEAGATMVLKAKRAIGNRGERRYRRAVERASASKGAMIIDPGISAVRVIEACCAGVSIPFTSTALYVRERGLPSAYYDPTGWIQKDDKGAHGILILSGKEELRTWLCSVLENAQSGSQRGTQ